MRKYAAILAATALLVSTGMASAQSRNYDSSGAPKSSGIIAAQRWRPRGQFHNRLQRNQRDDRRPQHSQFASR